jgi:hypothetical protein
LKRIDVSAKMSFSHSAEIAMGFDTRVLTGVGVLAAVTEAGSFARAAETLGLTPSVERALQPRPTRDSRSPSATSEPEWPEIYGNNGVGRRIVTRILEDCEKFTHETAFSVG